MPSWRAAPVLVTGATGFIGGHLAKRLKTLGAEVHAVSRRPVGPGDWAWHTADLAEPAAAAKLVREIRPRAVFHLASAVTGARGVELVGPTMAGNLIGAVNLLTAVTTESPDTRVVLAGSVEEPRGDGTPSSPYAVAKWAATGYARLFHELWGVAVTVLRVAMVYGPAQPDAKKLVPYVIQTLLRGEDPEIGSGTRLVDWVYVDDVVDAFIRAAESERAAGQVLDIGSGVQVSIRDTVKLVAELVGGPARPRFGAIADRPLDNPQVSDPSAAGTVLGWRPMITLSEGLRRTIAWYRNEGNDR